MIRKLWFYPPLAFARLGPSQTPCDNFSLGASDLSPRGTGKTVIVPAETIRVAPDGTPSVVMPTEIIFKDAGGFRPICPFFELHGQWELDGALHSGPVTPAVLAAFGQGPGDLRWSIRVANLKAFHYTLDPNDRIEAAVEIEGDVFTRQALAATSAPGLRRPLIPPGQRLPLGSVQLIRPTAGLPELRLRFTPAAGAVYGPTDLRQRTQAYVLAPERLILNPNAPWCRFELVDDPRTNPSGLFAGAEQGDQSLGLVDDVCDGIIRCSLAGAGAAVARIVVGPPDYAPDRRPLVSLADGLADRVRRADVDDPAYVADEALTSLEARDLMERTLETMGNVNVDVQNDRARAENVAIARNLGQDPQQAINRAFPPIEPILGRPLPLTEVGRQRHRRFVALEVFEDILREQPELISRVIRPPLTGDRYYDRKMPVAMRGSDRHPLHLTRRQFNLLVAWARHLHEKTQEDT